jgi:NAD-dependent deacetylase
MRVIDRAGGNAVIEAATALKKAHKAIALTGAGISVGCGIPDFRSPGGLWTHFAPDEYATLEVFLSNPSKAWKLYRALGKILQGKKPGKAHKALSGLEDLGLVEGIVTQNVDNLHQCAGSKTVFEIHGDHHRLQCLECGMLEAVDERVLKDGDIPRCSDCGFPMKPNVVLFGEPVRRIGEIDAFLEDCDLLLVIGTSAQVYPAAGIPHRVKRNNGVIMEFNREPVLGLDHFTGISTITDYFFHGDVEETLPDFCRTVERTS